MRGSFKQTFVFVFKKKKVLKKRSVEPFLCRTQPYFSSRLNRLFALQSANFSISLTRFILTHIFLAFIFFFSHLLTRSLLCLACRSPFIYHFLLLFFLTPLHYLPLLSLYLCIILVKMVSRGVIVVVYSVLKGLLMVETCAVCNI